MRFLLRGLAIFHIHCEKTFSEDKYAKTKKKVCYTLELKQGYKKKLLSAMKMRNENCSLELFTLTGQICSAKYVFVNYFKSFLPICYRFFL